MLVFLESGYLSVLAHPMIVMRVVWPYWYDGCSVWRIHDMIVCMKVVKLQSVSCSVVIRCGKANGAVTTDGTYRVYSIFGQCTECVVWHVTRLVTIVSPLGLRLISESQCQLVFSILAIHGKIYRKYDIIYASENAQNTNSPKLGPVRYFKCNFTDI